MSGTGRLTDLSDAYCMTPDFIYHPPPRIRVDAIGSFPMSELTRLSRQRRVFSRLDWWAPVEWHNSNAFYAASSRDTIDAALLIVPVALADMNDLQSSKSTSAWIRWCAISDAVSASTILHPLFDTCENNLQQAGIERTLCIVESVHWLYANLRERGYSHHDEVITMVSRRSTQIPEMHVVPDVTTIRPATDMDIPDIGMVDSQAFEEQWQYPGFVLQRALSGSAYFTVAERAGRIVGYQFATCNDSDAHITRLAVSHDAQGNGIGATLLADSITYLRQQLGVRQITLNTQASNTVSQRLYTRFGFETLQPRLRVLCRQYRR